MLAVGAGGDCVDIFTLHLSFLSFFPRDVLDEILNLIGSVSEGFPTNFSYQFIKGDVADVYRSLLELLISDFLMYPFSLCRNSCNNI